MDIARAIIGIIMDITILMSLVTIALDIIKWAFNADRTTFGDYSGSFMDGMIKGIVSLPLKIVASVIVLAFKIVEAVVRTLVGLIAPKVAEKITFVEVDFPSLLK